MKKFSRLLLNIQVLILHFAAFSSLSAHSSTVSPQKLFQKESHYANDYYSLGLFQTSRHSRIYQTLLSGNVEIKKYFDFIHSPAFQPESLSDLADAAVRAGSIEKFLSSLPPEKFRDYVLIHSSRSLQDASKKKPRVVVFDQKNSWIFSFTDSSHRGGQMLEIIDFDHKEARFRFQAVDFKTNPPTKSPINPPQCMKCHGGEYGSPSLGPELAAAFGPRPNWDSWLVWRGVVGGRNDGFFWSQDQYPLPSPHSLLPNPSTKDDNTLIDDFFSDHSLHPRYKFLAKPFFHHGTDGPAYATKNNALNTHIAFRNLERISRGLMRLSVYPKIRKDLRSILCSASSNDSYPPENYGDMTNWPEDFFPRKDGQIRSGAINTSLKIKRLFEANGYKSEDVLALFSTIHTSFKFSDVSMVEFDPSLFDYYRVSLRWGIGESGQREFFTNLFSMSCLMLNTIDPI